MTESDLSELKIDHDVNLIACKEKINWYNMELAKELGRSQNLTHRYRKLKQETKIWAVVATILLILIIPMIYLSDYFVYFKAYSMGVIPVYLGVIVLPAFIMFFRRLSQTVGHSVTRSNVKADGEIRKFSLSAEREDCLMRINILQVQKQIMTAEYERLLSEEKELTS